MKAEQQIRLVSFSPTKTTRTILAEIARGTGKNTAGVIDMTDPRVRERPHDELEGDLVLIGAPVYAGRLPGDAADFLNTLRAKGTPAVLVVVYGNRAFDDALLEMKNIATDRGFLPVAAGAFIGEHSFSSDARPIAAGRPDQADLEKAFAFGRRIADRLEQGQSPDRLPALKVPGNFPYRDGMAAVEKSVIAVSDACDHCGTCVDACPKEAVDEHDNFAAVAGKCIFCCACIKACPQEARHLKDSPVKDIAKWLHENCTKRKEPEFFFPG